MTLDESLSAGPHAQLARLSGEWEGSTRTWFEPDNLADESPMTGRIRSILHGRFVMHEYQGLLQGKPFEGLAILGYDLSEKKFQMAWIDSFHMSTAIMQAEGVAGGRFSAQGSYYTGEDSPRWFWRTEVDIVDEDNIVITAFNISPEGEEAKATETRYSRKI